MVIITVDSAAPCLTCEETVEEGERAWWEPGVGIWHSDCPRPKNLAHYAKERARARELGR